MQIIFPNMLISNVYRFLGTLKKNKLRMKIIFRAYLFPCEQDFGITFLYHVYSNILLKIDTYIDIHIRYPDTSLNLRCF